MEIKTGLDFVHKINELDIRLAILEPRDGVMNILLPSGVVFKSHGDYTYVYQAIEKLYEKGYDVPRGLED
tara:strand:- start:200 stop:409 length:210 start_codon:yes stop_codon:yes gene_type:complete